MRKCPHCAEEIQDEAIKCKHCQSDVPKVDESGVSLESQRSSKKTSKRSLKIIYGTVGVALLMTVIGGLNYNIAQTAMMLASLLGLVALVCIFVRKIRMHAIIAFVILLFAQTTNVNNCSRLAPPDVKAKQVAEEKERQEKLAQERAAEAKVQAIEEQKEIKESNVIATQGSVDFVVIDQSLLNDPKELKLQAKRYAQKNHPATCKMLMWTNAKKAARKLPLTDAQLSSQVAVYDRNSMTTLNRLRLMKNGDVTEEY